MMNVINCQHFVTHSSHGQFPMQSIDTFMTNVQYMYIIYIILYISYIYIYVIHIYI